MDRKEFLENFLRCVDTGASTLDFRRYCRVKAQHLPRHMRQIEAYREELARLKAEEAEEAAIEVIEEVVTLGEPEVEPVEVTDSFNEEVCDTCGGNHTAEDCSWGGPRTEWEDEDIEDDTL